MSPKRKLDASDGDASKERKTVTTELKVEIIKQSVFSIYINCFFNIFIPTHTDTFSLSIINTELY